MLVPHQFIYACQAQAVGTGRELSQCPLVGYVLAVEVFPLGTHQHLCPVPGGC